MQIHHPFSFTSSKYGIIPQIMGTNSIKRCYIFGHLQTKLRKSNARKLNRVMIIQRVGSQTSMDESPGSGIGFRSWFCRPCVTSGCLLFRWTSFLSLSKPSSFHSQMWTHVISVCHEIISAWLLFNLAWFLSFATIIPSIKKSSFRRTYRIMPSVSRYGDTR